MNFGLIISSIALGISLTVSVVKFADWAIHADPRAIIRMGQWLLLFLSIAAVPTLILLLFYRQWTFAMMLGAGMLIAPVSFNWRAILPRRNFRPMWTKSAPPGEMRDDCGQPLSPDLVRRAAIILEDYLLHAGHPGTIARLDGHYREVLEEIPPASRREEAMTNGEALEILGLPPAATDGMIRAAHHRLLQLVHPDRGGTNYLAAQINRAKETLLANAAEKPGTSPRNGTWTGYQRAAVKDK